MDIIQEFLIVSGIVFWFILLYIVVFFIKETFTIWNLRRIFKRYWMEKNKVQEGE